MSKIVITGPTCSGKSSLKNKLVSRGHSPIIQFTTRKSRPGEVDGESYYFITEEELKEKIDEGSILFYHTYENNTTYGIYNISWLQGNVLSAGIKEYQKLPAEAKSTTTVIYINPDIDIIKEKLAERGDSNEEANRRIESDARDYAGFDDWDIMLNSHDQFKI